MSRKFFLKVAAVSAAAALSFGAVGTASAQGSLGSSGSSLGSSTPLPDAEGIKENLGTTGDPTISLYRVRLNLQMVDQNSYEVAPGQEFTTRVEIQGLKGETSLNEIKAYMDESFKLVRVIRLMDSGLSSEPQTLPTNTYAQAIVDGKNEVRLSWLENKDLLGWFKGAPTIRNAQPLAIDFVWQAPQMEGEYHHGAGVSTNAAIKGSLDVRSAHDIIVKKGALNAVPVGDGSLSLNDQ